MGLNTTSIDESMHQFEFIIVLTSDELFIFFIALLAVSNQAGPVQTGL